MAVVTTALLATGCGDLLDPSEAGNLVPATVDEDISLPYVDINGTRLHTRTFGDPENPVIVFLHGGPGSSLFGLLPYHEEYDGYSLAEDYFLVFWDQRGAGLSRRHSAADFSWERQLQDLDLLVEHFSPQAPVHLVGYSFGGAYAASYVDRFADRVDGLVLLSAAPFSGELYLEAPFIARGLSEGQGEGLWLNEYFAPDDHARLDYAIANAAIDAVHPDFEVDFDELPSFRRFGQVSQFALYQDLGMIPPPRGEQAPEFDFTKDLDRFTQPVFAVAGATDRLFGERFQRMQLELFSASELLVIEGYGHDVGFDYETGTGSLRRLQDPRCDH